MKLERNSVRGADVGIGTAGPESGQFDYVVIGAGSAGCVIAARLSGDSASAMRADDEFHGIIIEASRNEIIPAVLEQVTPVLRRLEYRRFSSLSGRQSIAQHKKIIDLCRKGDVDGAAAATQQNWETLSVSWP